jgi:hypothetical protein
MPGEVISQIVHGSLLGLYAGGGWELDRFATEHEKRLLDYWQATGVKPKVGLIVDIDGVIAHPVWDFLNGLPVNRLGKVAPSDVKALLELSRGGVPVRLWTSRFEVGVGDAGVMNRIGERISGLFEFEGGGACFPFVSPAMRAVLAQNGGGNLEIHSWKAVRGGGLYRVVNGLGDVDVIYYIGSSPHDDAKVCEYLGQARSLERLGDCEKLVYIRLPHLFL